MQGRAKMAPCSGSSQLVAALRMRRSHRAQPVAEIAPTGKLRAAINYGNAVLASKDANGQPQGVSVDLARALGARIGVPVELVTYDAAGKVSSSVEPVGHRVPRHRPGARDGHRIHRAVRHDRRRLSRSCKFSYQVERGSRPRRHARRRRRRQRVRPLPHARAQGGDARARADVARGGRHDGRAEPRRRSGREAAARSRRRRVPERAAASRAASW